MTFRTIPGQLQYQTLSDITLLQKLKQNVSPFNFAVEVEYYNFSGVTYEEARKNMHIEAKKVFKTTTDDGGIVVGNVNTAFDTSFKGFRYTTNRQSITAYPVGMTIQSVSKVILPNFNGIALPEELEKIQHVVKGIIKHEQVHVCIALTTFNDIKKVASGINGKGRTKLAAANDLNANIKIFFDAILIESKAKQTKYDKETDHGLIAIEQEKYNKNITAECDTYYQVK